MVFACYLFDLLRFGRLPKWPRPAGLLSGSLLTASLVSGCAYLHVPYVPQQTGALHTIANLDNGDLGYRHDGAEPLRQAVRNITRYGDPAAFGYVRGSVEATDDSAVQDHVAAGHGFYRLRRLSFPSLGDNGQAGVRSRANYYESKLPGRKKLLIILPIWGGSKYPSIRIAEGVLERNDGAVNVLVVDGERDMVDWKMIETAQNEDQFVQLTRQYMAERIRTTVIDIRRWVDWADARQDIDTRHMGLIGFSISSIIGSAAYAVDHRLSTGIFVIGGANPDEILASCHWEPEELRNIITTRFGWDVHHYQEVLHPLLEPINPARFGAGVDPRHVLIFDSYYDSCMPASSREALWEAMGRPERISFLQDHKVSFMSVTPLGLNIMRVKIYDFLDRNL